MREWQLKKEEEEEELKKKEEEEEAAKPQTGLGRRTGPPWEAQLQTEIHSMKRGVISPRVFYCCKMCKKSKSLPFHSKM